MIDGVKPYPAYKDSGVPWLGEIPEHWVANPLGRMGQFFKGNGGTKSDEVSFGVPCVRYGDLYTQHEFFIRRCRSFVTIERSAYYTPIRKGDILFAASGETVDDIGRSAANLIEGEACCGGDVIVFRANCEVLAEFLGYACDSPAAKWQKARMGRGFTVVHIYAGELKYLTIAIPPLIEQAAIVRFLDHAVTRIGRYVRAKQKLIKLLEEEKQAIIQRAVTRGLDPNVRLKPSGVEWLGDVPQHWEMSLNHVLMRKRKVLIGARHADYKLLSLTKQGIIIRDVESAKGKFSADMGTSQEVRIGDLIFCLFDIPETPRTVGLSYYDGMITGAYTVFECRDLQLAEYIDIFYRAMDDRKLLGSLYSGLRNTISPTRFLRVKIPVPPKNEQAAIVRYVGDATVKIHAAIEDAQREINLLGEYRARLIADVVTGKLDVREAAKNLSDETFEPGPLDEIEDLQQDEPAADDSDLEAADAA